MHHPGPVDGGQGRRHPDGQPGQVGRGQPPTGRDRPVEPHAVHVLGHQVRQVARQLGVDHPGGAEPDHPPRRRHLVPEHPQERGVPGQLRPQHLDGHRLPVVARAEEHRPHPTGPEPPQEPVGPDPLGVPWPQRRRPPRAGTSAALGHPGSSPTGALCTHRPSSRPR